MARSGGGGGERRPGNPQHKPRPTYNHKAARSAKKNTQARYARQRIRTEDRKVRKSNGDTCHLRRIARRREARASARASA